jgi:chorismate dehydratase
MDPLRITAVSYLNTFPFVFGIRNSGHLGNYRLDIAVPSVCADNLIKGRADIALIPVGAIPDLQSVHYISNYCIGAVSPVKTVLLLSHKPLNGISTIHLDWDSRTSVQLVKVLARHHWKISPAWKALLPGESENARDLESLVAIGDKTFALADKFEYRYDLAEEWIRFSSLPFVFAAWVSKSRLPSNQLGQFNLSLEYGVNHIEETVSYFSDRIPPEVDAFKYLKENISFEFDERKKRGLEYFLELLKG